MTEIKFNDSILALQKNLEYFARSLTNDVDDANDLIQETFLKALNNREKFAAETNLKAWMFTIMKNTYINSYRRKVKSRTFVDVTEDLYYLNNSKDMVSMGADSIMQMSELNEGIASLTEEYRTPFEMHTRGYKYKEIAENLDLSIGTVKSRIFFTRKKLAKSLKDYNYNN